jgi:membrane protein
MNPSASLMAETATTSKTQKIRSGRGARLRGALVSSVRTFFEEDSLILSASIAYYGLVGIFPFLLLLLGLSGIYISRYELAGTLAVVLDRYLPMKPDFILQNLVVISKSFGRVGLASFLLLLWASSGVFVPLEKALNRAWKVKSGRRWIWSRVLAVEFSVIFGFFFLVFCGLFGLNVYVRHWARLNLAPATQLWFGVAYSSLATAVTFGMTLFILMILFARLPNRALKAREVLPGTLVTTVLWELSRVVFTLLLKHFNYRHVYGSIGAVVALMTWAYISAAVLLFGARISRQLYCAMYPEKVLDAEPSAAPSLGSSSK